MAKKTARCPLSPPAARRFHRFPNQPRRNETQDIGSATSPHHRSGSEDEATQPNFFRSSLPQRPRNTRKPATQKGVERGGGLLPAYFYPPKKRDLRTRLVLARRIWTVEPSPLCRRSRDLVLHSRRENSPFRVRDCACLLTPKINGPAGALVDSSGAYGPN